MRIASVSENQKVERRIAITPEIAKKYISLGIEVSLSENYASHLGIKDEEFKESGVSILKDNVKCYKSALACDPVSAFGGIVSCNFKINKKLSLELNKIFLEVIIGNGFDNDALKILKKKKTKRLTAIKGFSFLSKQN